MINLDDLTKENITKKKNPNWLIQNINSWRFWIWERKFIIKFNKS